MRPVAGVAVLRFVDESEGKRDEGVEEVVEFVLVAEVGPDLAADGVDGGLVEAACAVGNAVGKRAAERDGAGAALFEAGLVEEGVGVGVEEFVGELRGDGRVDGEAADGAGLRCRAALR